jgi:hypothetical protein
MGGRVFDFGSELMMVIICDCKNRTYVPSCVSCEASCVRVESFKGFERE